MDLLMWEEMAKIKQAAMSPQPATDMAPGESGKKSHPRHSRKRIE